MKLTSFKKYLEEQEHDDTKHIIQTGLNSKGIMNDVTKDILNSRLAMATDSPFLTPYIALGSVARVVAYANIILPQYVFMDRDEGEVVFDATQFGEIAGINIDGSPARPNVDHYIYFSYAMNDNGYFDCFAALVDSDELEQIMDMGGDDSVDHVHNDQKVNEESDYFAGVRPSLDVFTHTDEKGTKHFLSFHKNGDITYHHKTSDGKTGNTHSKMNPLYSKSSKDHFHNATHDFFRYVSKEKVDESNWIKTPNDSHYNLHTGVSSINKGEDTSYDDAKNAHDYYKKEVERLRANPNSYKSHIKDAEMMLRRAKKKLGIKEELKGDQHKLDVAEPKGKLTSADFKKLRGEEVDEGFDKWRNKLKKRNWLRKSGYEKSSVDHTSPGNTAALAVRAGRDKLKKEEAQHVDEAMKWDKTSSSSLPAMDQDTIKGHEQASTWHAKMLRQVRMNHDKNPNAETRRDVKFYSNRMAHHNGAAHDMRMQGVKEEAQHVDEEPTNPAAQAAQELKDRIAAHQQTKKK